MITKKEVILRKVRALAEVNPMLGHRGVRLGITYPEIYSMQIQAILEASALCAREGVEIYPEIMVPQVGTVEELKRIHSIVQRIHKVVELTHGIKVQFKFGSMLEVVRGCLRAGRMAEDAEFFSFGTNDLTQATFSFSREDAENKFLPAYNETGILQDNPFEVLDIKGVGELMKMAAERGRRTRPELKLGICGEHGGDPVSIHFCHHIGMSYVSCSGPRVPIARLAAAQAKLLEKDYRPPAEPEAMRQGALISASPPPLRCEEGIQQTCLRMSVADERQPRCSAAGRGVDREKGEVSTRCDFTLSPAPSPVKGEGGCFRCSIVLRSRERGVHCVADIATCGNA